MNLILCCGNAALRERWHTALHRSFSISQASSLQDLKILVLQKIPFDLFFVHRVMVDEEIIRYIRLKLPTCKLFILSDRPNDNEGLSFIRMGIIGYANSYINQQRLHEAAQAVASGSVWINQQLMQRLIAESAPINRAEVTIDEKEKKNQILEKLSDRENQIADLIAEGMSNLEIAARLGITERTVKAHLGSVYAKTATSGRLALALLKNQTKKA